HHLLMDGWSLPVLVRELLTLYEHKGDGAALGRVTPYRDYLAWLARQDRAGARAAWQQALAGGGEGTPGAAPGRGGEAGVRGRRGSRLWREWKKPRMWRRRIAGVRRLRPSR